MLLITPPATMAAIVTSLFAVYCLIVVLLPLPHAAKTGALAITAIVAVIVQIASWLIYNARRSDHDQRRLIRAQYKLLARQNHELDELMAITAHDLRSPLHGLRNVLDFAARRAEGGDPAILLRAVREGTHSIDAMLTLVTRLLDANEAGHAPLVAVMRDDMRTHVLAAARRVAPQAVHAGIRLDLDLPNRAMWVNIDGGALGQILDNLLANGIRHSPAGEALRLACSLVGSNVLVTIEDRGPGIDPARRAALFTKFNRGDPRASARGAGMGLFIAATLAGRSNAGLVFRPAEPHGALFELSVPIVP
jgi:signal transduction histidine kinase